MPDPSPVPKGLVFFPPDTPPGHRRRRLLFVVILMTAAAALVWPVYPLFSGIFPLILGLPLSMAWIVLWLTIMLVALAWLYRSEGSHSRPRARHAMPLRGTDGKRFSQSKIQNPTWTPGSSSY